MCIRDSLYTAQLNMNMNIEENTQNIPFIEISIMLGTGIIYIYQLSYEILKQRETIGTYQLLGMRKFEIWRIYVYKSGMIALIGFVCAVYYHFEMCIRDRIYADSQKIARVFNNILKNAFYYGDEKTTITIEATEDNVYTHILFRNIGQTRCV